MAPRPKFPVCVPAYFTEERVFAAGLEAISIFFGRSGVITGKDLKGDPRNRSCSIAICRDDLLDTSWQEKQP